MVIRFVITYIFIMSIIGFFQMGIDKYKAKKQKWRISERTLLLTAFVGGSFGSLLGMYLFRHKTKHNTFRIFIPTCCALHLVILYLVCYVL